MSYLLDTYRAHEARKVRMWRGSTIKDTGIMSPREWAQKQADERAAREEQQRAIQRNLELICSENLIREEMAQINAERDEIVANITETKPIQAKRIMVEVAKQYGLTVAELRGHRRLKKIVEARHTAIYRVAKATGWSLPKIGRLFDKDHTSILHAIRIMEKKLAASNSVSDGSATDE